MCGICGKIRLDGQPVDPNEIEYACQAIRHRGPDDGGVYAWGSVGLGHRRLSIIDLSSLGHQPMTNEDRTVWIVFNGEIYNFQELRPDLEAKGHTFRSRTDTEVILHLYEELGPGCVDRLRGMFAFAIWDEKERTLFLARDRVGKKPLFYCHTERFFSFGSELGALVADHEISRDVDNAALHHYLTYQSVPAPFTAYRAVRRLPPGHWLRLRDGRVDVQRYWKLSFADKLPADTPTRRRAIEEGLLEKIREAVRLRLVSDVPLGALLSGGVDSSGIVALMAGETPGRPVKTFSVGFEEKEYNELQYARMVSGQYGTDHSEFTLRPEMLEVLPTLVEHFGEPFADSAAIPLYYITRVARQAVTVALCGDGGDESFAGYDRHRLLRFLHGFDAVPPWLTRGIYHLLRPLPHGLTPKNPIWVAKRFFQCLSLPPERRNVRFFGNFDNESKAFLYTPDFAKVLEGVDSDDIVGRHFRETDAVDLVDAILYCDINTYLPDTLLPKVDITSMANSLEMRSPLLDHELMEFAARIPANLKLHGLTAKYILKKTFEPLLPKKLLHRPKMGFGIPIARWFREELRQKVEETILSRRAVERGYFRPEAIRRILAEHQTGKWQWHSQIYNLLMLEEWQRRFIDRR